jgi:hypothetical protein
LTVTGAVEYALVLPQAGIESLHMARCAVEHLRLADGRVRSARRRRLRAEEPATVLLHGLLDSSEGCAFPHAHIHTWSGMGHHPLRERFDDLIELLGQARAAALGQPRPPAVVKVA